MLFVFALFFMVVIYGMEEKDPFEETYKIYSRLDDRQLTDDELLLWADVWFQEPDLISTYNRLDDCGWFEPKKEPDEKKENGGPIGDGVNDQST